MTAFTLFCGDVTCVTRVTRQPDGSFGQLFVVDEADLVDGEVWLCPGCRFLAAPVSGSQTQEAS